MDCESLNKLIRNWYIQVQEETLAPARMVEFMSNHVLHCDTCLMDANVRAEIKKITAIVLPPSKMTKPAKSNKPTVIPPGYPPPPEPMEPAETVVAAPEGEKKEDAPAEELAKLEKDGSPEEVAEKNLEDTKTENATEDAADSVEVKAGSTDADLE